MNNNNNKIKVLVVKPFLPVETVEIENTLKGWQDIVEGYVESVTLKDGIVVMCNEEGRLNGLDCCCIDGIDFVGNVFIAHFDEENLGEIRGLTDKEIVSLKYGMRIRR